MAKKIETNDLLEELSSEASAIRKSNASVTSGMVRKGEDIEPSSELEPEEPQNIEKNIENEDAPDEEPEEAIEDAEEDEDEEDEDEEDDTYDKEIDHRRNQEHKLRRQLQKRDEQISQLQSKVTKFEDASTQSAQKEIGKEIAELAEELKLDPAGLEKIVNKTLELAERRISSKLPPQEMYSDFEDRAERVYFESEWQNDSVQGYLEDNYPRATARQLQEAKTLLDNLAHSEEGGTVGMDKNGKERIIAPTPLDYLMWKHKNDFDVILNSKKRHGLESANRSSIDDSEQEPDRSTSKGWDALDSKYSQILGNDSGLHRARPRST